VAWKRCVPVYFVESRKFLSWESRVFRDIPWGAKLILGHHVDLVGRSNLAAHSRYFLKFAPLGRKAETCLICDSCAARPASGFEQMAAAGVRLLRSEFAVLLGQLGILKWPGGVAAMACTFCV